MIVWNSPLPALLTVVKEINEPRVPSLKGKMRAKSQKIPLYGAAESGPISSRPSWPRILHPGHSGFRPARVREKEWLTGSVENQVGQLLHKLIHPEINSF